MPKVEQKQVVINEIKEKMNGALSIVLVDARGLSVAQDTVLRKSLREAGVVYKVYKNSMMEFAFKDTEYAELTQYLEGPTTVAFSYDDPTSAARIIVKQIKDMPNLEFKGGVVDGVLYDAKAMEAIAKIPSKEELLSKLLGSFKSPMSSFARVINAIAEQKESGGESAPKAEEAAPAEAVAPAEEAVQEPVAVEAAAEEPKGDAE